MPSEHVKPSKKPSGARAIQTSIFSSAASSRFRKRQASEGSQGWSATESTGDSGSSTNEDGRWTPSRSGTHYTETSASSGGEEVGSYSSRAHVRLVNSRHPSDAASTTGPLGMDTSGMSTVMEAQEDIVESPGIMSPRPSTPSKPSQDQAFVIQPPSRTTTPVPSTSRTHWNQLRSAIIPGPSIPPDRPVPNVSFPQSAIAAPPPRPQTPKPSRLARLGFRQVVDQTREVVHDETGRFEADIYQACASARFGEGRHRSEREGSQATYLPFMSTASLPLSTITATSSQPNRSTQPNELIGRSAPSLKLLHQILLRYAPLASGPNKLITWLPYESEVLSVLLIPFSAASDQHDKDEQWLAVETFEIASKTWPASSHQREIDRVLWCCKAGLIPASPVRSRLLGTLSNLLFSTTPLQDGSPLALQNVLQGLQLLLHAFSEDPRNSTADTQIVRELCTRVLGGECGQLDVRQIEQEYDAQWGTHDEEVPIRAQIAAEGVVRCMQSGSESLRRWILHESVENHWTPFPDTFSPLCKRIVARRLSAFLRAALSMLRLDAAQSHRRLLDSDSTVVIRLLQHQALPELQQLPVPTQMNDSRALVVELLLELLSIDSQRQKRQVIELICGWCDDAHGWKESLETGLRLVIERVEWSHLTEILQDVVTEIPDEERKKLVPTVFMALHVRMVMDPAPHPLPGLTSLLRSLVQLYPHQFYKPLFSLAGTSKDPTIVGQLAVVTALARHLPEFWIHDPEMVSVALMSDIGGAIGKGKAKEGQPIPWGKTRVGQSLIILELIRCVKGLTKDKKDPLSPPDGSQNQAYRFVTGLEARLAILIEAKEKSVLIPFSQRVLLSVLLLETRLFTRSLKPAPWLPRIVIWAAQSYPGAKLEGENNLFSDRDETSQQVVGDDAFDEVMSTVSKIQSIYIACWQSPPSNARQRSTMVLSPSFDPRSPVAGIADQPEVNAEAIKEREELMASLSTGVTSAALRLLVAMCALLTQTDHHTLGPVIWSHFLDEDDPAIVAPACFLLTHCLEKSSKDVTKHIDNDRSSSESAIRRTLVRRLMILFAWRSQLLSQTYIYDRARRRPFKLARQPIAFVAIDVGSGSYVHEQTEEDRKNHPGGNLPFELRKRLAEVGWEQDDQPTDTRMETIRAPISLFPAPQLDHLNAPQEHATISPSRTAESAKQLLRRKSSASGHHPGVKRRPVFVPALVSMFSSVALLAVDSDPVVASAAREAILLMLRDDPVMLCRPVLDTLSTDLVQVGSAISVLRAFLHVHHRLPPSASHHIFSHLGGFLKHVSRDADDPKALRAFSYTVPVLAKLITQVSNLSIRDLRRSKFEMYVFPSGSLWFPPTAPPSTMFPQSLGPTINPFDELPPQLVGICMIRTAQNMLLLDMLKHKPQEVHVIRKSLNGLVLPGENTGKELDARSFLPRRSSKNKPRRAGYQQVSLALSRSYLLLLGQVFRSMSRNFNGKAELDRLFDGLNKILLAHGDDIGIVTHALIACMVAITRFKRLVSGSGGFALFMPGLLKVYAEAEGHSGIRHAIQYASSRFYAIHQEAYLFQSLELASNILVRLDRSEDRDWFAKNIWQLFSALKAAPHRIPDAAGVRESNRTEEREALIATTVTDETPRPGTQDSPRGEQLKKILAAGQYENKLLQLDDLVRLFLTVIAHDPTIMRAQNFLALFRRMAPEFYNSSNSARGVLRDGINALGNALFVRAPRQRVHESAQVRPLQHGSVEVFSHESNDSAGLFDDPSSPCDHMIMRREYLNLVVAFSRTGGDLRDGTVRRALDLVKGLLKETSRPEPDSEGTFLHELADTSLSRLSVTAKQAFVLLQDVAPVIRAFALSMDCSGVLQTITDLLKRPELASNDAFVHLVVEQVAGPVLESCDDAASENLLLSLPMRPAVVSLVSHAAALKNADIISVIEKQSPTPGFLAGVVLPLCLTIKTSGEIATENQWQNQDRLGKHGLVFVRLLAYAMDACQTTTEGDNGRSSPLPTLNRRDSQRSKRSSLFMSRAPLATLTIAVQIIKIIVIRAADDLSSGLTGIWARVARFLQQILDDGDARFALPKGSSPTPSPWQSPTLGPSPGGAHARTHSVSSDYHAPPHSPASKVGPPRVVDYLTWSLLEYLCCAPSPLTLQMRLWMQEKVHNLDTELKVREVSNPFIGTGSRRLSSSVFAKARRSSASPDALRASRGLSSTPSELNLSVSTSTDLAAYNRFPPSPSPGSLQPSWTGPRIVHLGPAKDHHQMFQAIERSSSQDSHLKNLARTSHVGLPVLVRSTYGRIRVVQTCMGYDRLLPIEGQGNDTSDMDMKAWTRPSAMTRLVVEAKLLMEEFGENFYENVGADFVDVPLGAGFGSTQNSPEKGLR